MISHAYVYRGHMFSILVRYPGSPHHRHKRDARYNHTWTNDKTRLYSSDWQRSTEPTAQALLFSRIVCIRSMVCRTMWFHFRYYCTDAYTMHMPSTSTFSKQQFGQTAQLVRCVPAPQVRTTATSRLWWCSGVAGFHRRDEGIQYVRVCPEVQAVVLNPPAPLTGSHKLCLYHKFDICNSPSVGFIKNSLCTKMTGRKGLKIGIRNTSWVNYSRYHPVLKFVDKTYPMFHFVPRYISWWVSTVDHITWDTWTRFCITLCVRCVANM